MLKLVGEYFARRTISHNLSTIRIIQHSICSGKLFSINRICSAIFVAKI